ncbi:MAG: hypothetical protein Q8P18_05305 [Pseudomonadota bacterium]|nr:hypothetical protein [Pseudomonadota bacterium]
MKSLSMLLLLSACDPLPTTVTMSGTVGDTPYGGGGVVAGATIDIVDDALASIDSQTADDAGAFSVSVPAGVPFFVTVAAEGYVPTAFSGTAGINDFEAPDGYPWVASDAWFAALRAEFAACPTVNATGAVVAGEVRGNIPGTPYTDLPLVATGSVRAFGEGEIEYPACYLDDAGVSVADAAQVGDTGRFVIFGVPPGPIVVDVRYVDPAGDEPVQLFRFVAPEDGFVPIYPALVEAL